MVMIVVMDWLWLRGKGIAVSQGFMLVTMVDFFYVLFLFFFFFFSFHCILMNPFFFFLLFFFSFFFFSPSWQLVRGL